MLYTFDENSLESEGSLFCNQSSTNCNLNKRLLRREGESSMIDSTCTSMTECCTLPMSIPWNLTFNHALHRHLERVYFLRACMRLLGNFFFKLIAGLEPRVKKLEAEFSNGDYCFTNSRRMMNASQHPFILF